jgi:acyl-CoA synthetase (AMP-forming)/AMP-acid ligase II
MTDVDAGVAPVYRDDPRLAPLIGPGAPFEVEALVLDGVPLRDFVRAPRTIVDMFDMGAAHVALVNIVYEEERLTFADVRSQARNVARQLQESFGVRPGDRVAIAMRNLPEFVVAFWATALAGAVVVPLNSWWAGGELTYALGDAGVTVMFADEERIDRVTTDGRPDGLAIVGVRAARGDASFDDLASGDPVDDGAIARLGRDDPVTLLYTSGTTGRPKGALASNRAHVANLWNMAFASSREAIIAGRPPPPAQQPASLAAAPLFHIGGVAMIIGSPMGATKILLMRKWSVEEGLRLAREERVTSLGGVPAIARQLLEHPDITELGPTARVLPMGGAPVPPDLPARAVELFGDHAPILNGYGSTETTSAVVTNVGVEYATHLDSVGRPNLTADIRVVDTDGRTLASGETGEICARSPQVVSGYWNDEAATKAAFVDGWFHTGDVGYVDAEGYVHVVDRIKDVVIRGGENVYCLEVEAVLQEHPAVAEVAVVGIDERAMGERVCAVVVVQPGVTVELADLRAFAAPRLARFKCPEALSIVPELPRTATGKVAKNALRASVAGSGDGVVRGW